MVALVEPFPQMLPVVKIDIQSNLLNWIVRENHARVEKTPGGVANHKERKGRTNALGLQCIGRRRIARWR